MIFYDFEVFKEDWLVVLADTTTLENFTIVNNRDELVKFYESHKNDIYVGFNNKHYDQYIFKGIIAGFNPKEVNDWIIRDGKDGWMFSDVFRKIPMINYDVMQGLDRGLKFFEGSMGEMIKESDVSFNLDRKLTDSEIEDTITYCMHDVINTMSVFQLRESDFTAQMGLLEMFGLPLSDVSKTKVQLSAKILEAKKRDYNDEFDISIPTNLRIKKYKEVVEWYEDPENRKYIKEDGKKNKLEINIAGVPHVFGWGGVHGALEKYNCEGYFINMDVASLYPSLMIEYNLHSRSCKSQKFNDIVETRLKYKAEKNPLQAPLKIVINGTYGAMKDKYNPLYDPRQANNVCVHGQLFLLDLMEHLEPHGEIIQSNTDGILIRMPDGENPDEWFSKIDDVAYEWETRTRLKLEFDEYIKVVQKDVNNYVIIDADGKYKSKGAYVKKLSPLDYDLPIVNKAVVDYIVKDVPVETTIMTCAEPKEFQQIKKISYKYDYLVHQGEILNERCVRVFASLNEEGTLYKKHSSKDTWDKVEGTPTNCFVYNENMCKEGFPISKLDKHWYIEEAKNRLRGFGYEFV